MSFVDREIQCADCGSTFTFSASEQELFAQRGYTNDPKRCSACRASRKSQNGGGLSNFGSSSRQMFPVVCAECGKETEVPFEPRGGRPVYCRDCYNKTRPTSSRRR